MPYGSTLSTAVDSPSARKERGAFFTPSELSDSLVEWAITSRDDVVLEPACGEAQFLLSSLTRLQSLGAGKQAASAQVVGCELHAESADVACSRCAEQGFAPEVLVGDFFEMEAMRRFDAVVGNPPYVRFQLIDGKQRESMREVTHASGLGLSALSSAWAPFVIHASSFLKEGGRLAFVLPAELLTVNYAAPIRTFLMSSYAEITVITFDERVFPEVQEEVVLLLAGGYQQGSADCISWRQCVGLADIASVQSTRYHPVALGSRWSAGMVPAAVNQSLGRLEGAGFTRLSSWGTVSLGAVTGNNKFFALTEGVMEAWQLGSEDALALCPPGSRHVRRLDLTAAALSGLERSGKQTWLFYPGEGPSAAALRYIQYGHEHGVDTAYKCRKRSPWWRVPVPAAPDAFLTYMNDFAPSVCANYAQARCLNSVHGIVFADGLKNIGMGLFPLACINSVTLLSSELEGRAYGGGVLKLEPSEAARLLVPSAELVSSVSAELLAIRGNASDLLAQGDVLAVRDMVDSVFSKAGIYEVHALEQARTAKERLYTRRRTRSKRRQL